jgi:hypothetical protein
MIIWGFQGMLKFWWHGLPFEQTSKIIKATNPIDALVEVFNHEFFGKSPIYTKQYASLFMSQRLCDLYMLESFKCEMQKLLYKNVDSSNIDYL